MCLLPYSRLYRRLVSLGKTIEYQNIRFHVAPGQVDLVLRWTAPVRGWFAVAWQNHIGGNGMLLQMTTDGKKVRICYVMDD